MGTFPMGDTSSRSASRCGTSTTEIVVEPDRADAAVDPRMRQDGAHLAELERLRPDREVSRELRLGEAEEALARAVLRRAIVDAERVRLGGEVAVDLERREGPRDRRRVDLAQLPSDPRVRVNAEVAHEGGEVDARGVEPRVLQATAMGERVDDRVREDERSPREVERRLRAVYDVAADGQLARQLVGEHVLVEPQLVRLDRPADVRQEGVVGVADLRIHADPAARVGQAGEALRERNRGADVDVPIDGGRAAGHAGEHDVEVPERELDPARVPARQVAGRRGLRGWVEVGGADRLKAPHQDGARLDPDPPFDLTEGVVVAGVRPVGKRTGPLDVRPSDPQRRLERRSAAKGRRRPSRRGRSTRRRGASRRG